MELFRQRERGETTSEREERFDKVYRSYFAPVLNYALRRATPEVAHDVVADTFLIAWRRLERLPEEPLPWLLGIARKTLANQRRSARRRDALLGELEAGEVVRAQEHSREPHAAVSEITVALERLPDSDRELLRLIAWEGLSVVEAAQVVGQSAATCRVRLHRARRRLLRELARGEALPESFTTIPKEQL